MREANHLMLSGKIIEKPILKYTPSAMAVCETKIASKRSTKKNGQWVETEGVYPVVIFGKRAETLANKNPGECVIFEAEISSREYQDKNGAMRFSVEIIARNFYSVINIEPQQEHDDFYGDSV